MLSWHAVDAPGTCWRQGNHPKHKLTRSQKWRELPARLERNNSAWWAMLPGAVWAKDRKPVRDMHCVVRAHILVTLHVRTEYLRNMLSFGNQLIRSVHYTFEGMKFAQQVSVVGGQCCVVRSALLFFTCVVSNYVLGDINLIGWKESDDSAENCTSQWKNYFCQRGRRYTALVGRLITASSTWIRIV